MKKAATVFRTPIPTDLPGIMHVHGESFIAGYTDPDIPNATEPFLHDFVHHSGFWQRAEKFWTGVISPQPDVEQRAVLASVDEIVVGIGRAAILRTNETKTPSGHISALYVAPEFWRRGIGTAIHNTLIDFLADEGDVTAAHLYSVPYGPGLQFYTKNNWQRGETVTDKTISPLFGVTLPALVEMSLDVGVSSNGSNKACI